jgi:Uma2 family endonuclease
MAIGDRKALQPCKHSLPIHLTPEEYLRRERQAETKSEYWDGQVYALAGASQRHTIIVANILALAVMQFKGRSCTAHGSDLRVKVGPTELYTYPDIRWNGRRGDRSGDLAGSPGVGRRLLTIGPGTQKPGFGQKPGF